MSTNRVMANPPLGEGWLLQELFESDDRSPSAGADETGSVDVTSTCEPFVPAEPQSVQQLGVRTSDVDGILLRVLAARGERSGRQLAEFVRLPPSLVEILLKRLRDDGCITVRKSAGAVDYRYVLSSDGEELLRSGRWRTTYAGPVPVSYEDYVVGLQRQAAIPRKVTRDRLLRAYAGLRLQERALDQLGRAVTRGTSALLTGCSGNGKSRLAAGLEFVCTDGIWIPRTINLNGLVTRVFDPDVHQELSPPRDAKADQRWVFVRRPFVMTGRELTPDALELRVDPLTGIADAPLHVKANGGLFVVDDLGRHSCESRGLVNRLLLPLSDGRDLVLLPSGRTVRLPLEQMLVLVASDDVAAGLDESTMQRIPYKIRVPNPSPAVLSELFVDVARQLGLACDPTVFDRFLAECYGSREPRYRHAHDLLRLVQDACEYRGAAPIVTAENLAEAATIYFGGPTDGQNGFGERHSLGVER